MYWSLCKKVLAGVGKTDFTCQDELFCEVFYISLYFSNMSKRNLTGFLKTKFRESRGILSGDLFLFGKTALF